MLLGVVFLSLMGHVKRTHRTVKQAIQQNCLNAKQRLEESFRQAKLSFNPLRIAFVCLKQEKQLELWAMYQGGQWSFVRTYDILGASGVAGPKLREGDRQVPEGFYRISFLNPNSRYHLSMRVSYPNEFDRRQAKREGRTRLGGDIMIHGKSGSSGCLAVGDRTVEELFYLVHKVGVANVEVIIVPYDFRKQEIIVGSNQPKWVQGLYKRLEEKLKSSFISRPEESISLSPSRNSMPQS
jgi:murein L,D-transpeptidase YafK